MAKSSRSFQGNVILHIEADRIACGNLYDDLEDSRSFPQPWLPKEFYGPQDNSPSGLVGRDLFSMKEALACFGDQPVYACVATAQLARAYLEGTPGTPPGHVPAAIILGDYVPETGEGIPDLATWLLGNRFCDYPFIIAGTAPRDDLTPNLVALLERDGRDRPYFQKVEHCYGSALPSKIAESMALLRRDHARFLER